MAECKSKVYLLKGYCPAIGVWCRNIDGIYSFGNSFEEAEYNIINNIRDEEKEKFMIEKMKL